MERENQKYYDFGDGKLVIDLLEDGYYEVYFEYEDEDINIVTTDDYDIALKFFNDEKKHCK